MSELIVHWNILPEYLELYLFKWNQDNPPVLFLRRAGQNHRQGTKAREPWHLTDAGRADLEAWRERGIAP